MTTERWARRGMAVTAGLAMVLLASLSCAATTQTRHGDHIDVRGYPPRIQQAYREFAARCSRCHTLARPLNARIDDPAHWVRYVRRMRRNPTSGINPKNADLILEFLLFYTAERARERQPEPTKEPIKEPAEAPKPTETPP